MVIHDMRNPCNSADYSIMESLNLIRESINDLISFNQNLKQSFENNELSNNEYEFSNDNILMSTFLNPTILQEKINRSKTLRKHINKVKFLTNNSSENVNLDPMIAARDRSRQMSVGFL